MTVILAQCPWLTSVLSQMTFRRYTPSCCGPVCKVSWTSRPHHDRQTLWEVACSHRPRMTKSWRTNQLHTHARARARTHARTCTNTHTHTPARARAYWVLSWLITKKTKQTKTKKRNRTKQNMRVWGWSNILVCVYVCVCVFVCVCVSFDW